MTQTRLNLGKVETANSKLSQFRDCEINSHHPVTGLHPRKVIMVRGSGEIQILIRNKEGDITFNENFIDP